MHLDGSGDRPTIDHGAGQPTLPNGLRFFGDSRWRNNNNAARSTGRRGDGITLTYGVVPDGTRIQDTLVGTEDEADPSNLRNFLGRNIGSPAVWQPLIDDAYQRWGELSGLTMVREDNDDGAPMGNPGTLGAIGVRPDMRIGGRFLDGLNLDEDGEPQGNVLAYNWSPFSGDHVVDTGNDGFYGNARNDYVGFRNVFMHEAGHGLGIAHFESSDSRGLMEPFIDTRFDGPQQDDILSVQRQYGDRFETGSGNDSFNNASALGSLTPLALTEPTASLAIGGDASDVTTSIGADDIDFVSIDGTSDRDVFAFTLTADGDVTLQLDPRGATYNEGPQDGAQSVFDTKALSDLAIDLLASDGTVLATANATGAGDGETIGQSLLAGSYFAVIRTGAGATDNVQLYELNVSAALIPEPTAVLALAGLGGMSLLRRRRAA